MLNQQAPSRARHWVVVFAVTLAVLSYIDRVAISKATPYIMDDLGLTKTQMGRVFSAFALSYALAEIPSGWMGDKLGPRNVLMRIVIWWSVFTASVTMMWNGLSLAINQFLFGAGEAGCFPNLTKTFTTWLPSNERVRAQGIMWMSARWGGAFTPILCAMIFTVLPWRAAFLIFACLGVIWAVFFFRWFRDDPKDHPAVNAAELALLSENRSLTGSHGDVPWRKLISNRSVWLLWVQYFLITYPWYFYITWLSTYIREYYGIQDEMLSARYAIFPLLFGGIGCILSGLMLPRIAKLLGSTTKARRVLASSGFLGASAFLLVCIQQKDPLYGMLAMGMASFCNDLVMPCAWGSCMDIGGKYAGTLSGSMNMMGNMAGFVAPQVGGIILDATRTTATPQGDYNMFIYTMAAAYFLGAFCWPFIDPTKPLEQTEAH
ncbi:MFS transporter [Paludibaculum fermentans]|uniref:MFS transporter n=1 Tax=Paludibaculum fermentans TaxID=1473598 RepID=UPI003EBF0728